MKKVIVMLAVLAIAAPVMAFHPTESCDRCHVPHFAEKLDGMPLWAGTDNPFDASTFIAYNTDGASAKLNSTPDDGTDLSGSTMVCLSCHDGGGSHEITETGGDLSETHPIEMVYDFALSQLDGELYNPLTNGGGTVVGGKGTIQQDMLDGDRVTCISCHEIHANGLHEGMTEATEDAGSFDRVVTNDNGTPLDDSDDFDETITTDVPAGTTYEMDYPHLVNVEGIRWSVVRRGNASDPEDYALVYGNLCMTCHKK